MNNLIGLRFLYFYLVMIFALIRSTYVRFPVISISSINSRIYTPLLINRFRFILELFRLSSSKKPFIRINYSLSVYLRLYRALLSLIYTSVPSSSGSNSSKNCSISIKISSFKGELRNIVLISI